MSRRPRPTLNLPEEKIAEALNQSRALNSNSAFSSSTGSSEPKMTKASSAPKLDPPQEPALPPKGPMSVRPPGPADLFKKLQKVKDIEAPPPVQAEPEVVSPAPVQKEEEKEAEIEEEDQEEAEAHASEKQEKPSATRKPAVKKPLKKKSKKGTRGGGPRRPVGFSLQKPIKPVPSSKTPSEPAQTSIEVEHKQDSQEPAISEVEKKQESPSEQAQTSSEVEKKQEKPSGQEPATREAEKKQETPSERIRKDPTEMTRVVSALEREQEARYQQSHPIARPPAPVRHPHPSPKVKTAEQHLQEFEARKQREIEIASTCVADLQTLRQKRHASHLQNLADQASYYHSPDYNSQFVPGPINLSKILESCDLARR